jgi:hypothetical protein
MRIRFGKPSPAMAVALVALVFAMTGTAAAVVTYARNAGAVNGKHAYSAGVSNARVAGNLVATRRSGPLRGTIPLQYLDPSAGRSVSFGRATDVIDNAGQAPFTIADIPGFGKLEATCGDQNNKVNVEDPTTTITFTNTSGQPLNFARATGTGGVSVAGLVPNQTSSFVVNGSNTYVINLLRQGTSLVVHGVVRQDGANTPSAFCVNYGQAPAVI